MASVRRKGDAVRVDLDPKEVILLQVLVVDVLQLLDPGPAEAGADPLEELTGMSSQPIESPTDPALQRLLPDAYAEDDEAAREFRRLTDSDLRGAKREALQHIVDALATGQPTRSGASRIVLDQANAAAWLPALTDVRLVLASRLGIEEEIDLERMAVDPGGPGLDEIALYDWLSYFQEAMVHAVARD